MSFDLSDYVDVSERERQLFERYPDARIQTELEEVRRADGELFAWKCKAMIWRTPDDPLPVIDYAVEPVPGKTPYTRDSEAMNASTSAIGRAIVLAGFPSKHIASADEVKARQGNGNPAEQAQAVYERAREERAPQDDGQPANVLITFGKFKGSTVGQTAPDYLRWLIGNFEPKTAEHRRILAAADAFLGAPVPAVDDVPF